MASCKFTIVARAFSSSSIQSQMIKTPVAVFGVGGRYASALYSAAVKQKEIDKVEQDMVRFKQGVLKDHKFAQVVKDPILKNSIKIKIMEEAAKKLSLSGSSTRFLMLLAENGRFKDFESILFNFKTLMAAHRKEITCEVTSAKPLTDAQKKEVETILKKLAKSDGVVLMELKVDPSIIGGLTVAIGNKFVDLSISSRIKKFERVLDSVL